MGRLSSQREEARLVAERASDWLHRLETADPKERAEFMAWLKESPRHVREMLLAGTWDKVLDTFDHHKRIDLDALFAKGAAEVVQLGAPATSGKLKKSGRLPDSRKRRAVWGLAAVVLVTLSLTCVSLSLLSGHYSTGIGEQRAFELDDGSTVHLNADSRVKVDFSETMRAVHLLGGQAIFKVEHDVARPFRVHVGGAYIQALGTQFDVHRRPGRITVAVIEGKVKIATDEKSRSVRQAAAISAPETLKAGEAASIAQGTITRAAEVDVSEATAWRQRRLVFRKDTLADMALEFNRYNHSPQVRVESAPLRMRQFNGVFDADDPQSLVRFLEGMDGVSIERRGDEIIIKER